MAFNYELGSFMTLIEQYNCDSMNLFEILFGKAIFNFIGGTIRWICGSIWRTLLRRPKFNFREYIDGPKNTNDHFDEHGHQINNVVIGISFVVGVILLLIK
ncbi:hypothetical protein [Jiulongibacter sp. NS-SX5]|uniref:hypothetical protein n=1 Tax=Jiulongibacter sp. NS-SX5 TaxID=3463854 RepID=UPI0040581798